MLFQVIREKGGAGGAGGGGGEGEKKKQRVEKTWARMGASGVRQCKEHRLLHGRFIDSCQSYLTVFSCVFSFKC